MGCGSRDPQEIIFQPHTDPTVPQTATAQLYSSIIAQSDINREAYDINATEDFGGQVNVTGANNLIRIHNISNSTVVAITDPLLGPLTTNGGPTLTHSILAGSPAIDQGSNQLSLAVDQRGATYARVVGVKVDIGAFERQAATAPDLPGDYNSNHNVDAADYVLWRKTKGASVPQYSGADGNGSGNVDDADYEVWRGNFGSPSLGAGAAVGSQSTLIAVEVQPAVTSAPRNDATLVATFTAFQPALSARTTTSKYDWLGDEGTLPLSQQSRDDALLAITAISYERRVSTGEPQFPTSDFDLRDRGDHSSDEALLLEIAIGTSELAAQCDSSI